MIMPLEKRRSQDCSVGWIMTRRLPHDLHFISGSNDDGKVVLTHSKSIRATTTNPKF